jgi:hypothetical protein
MGSVIQFPFERLSRTHARTRPQQPATVILLPVIRIERWDDGRQSEAPASAARPRRLRSRARTSK